MDMPYGVVILVCDGTKAFTLRNKGDIEYPNLEMLSVRTQENPPTHLQGADRPGRLNDPGTHTSAVDDTDWHRQREDHFASEIATELREKALANHLDPLIVVAPPRMLGLLRQHFGDHVGKRVLAEVAKDLVHHEVIEIERILKAA